MCNRADTEADKVPAGTGADIEADRVADTGADTEAGNGSGIRAAWNRVVRSTGR